ncbi:hypothetical protein [Psychrobacter sp. I-STPA6b]|uniref:hypothetical protein n=1 Tax=Psychrobacter sp. I-STPA6b TaxID=2585718 RepID=UPI001D0C95A0|nr:hypothetical protein [Psychrobacter sp. I-STPA6b]
MNYLKILILASTFCCISSYANCQRPIIEESVVKSLPEKVSTSELTKKFGEGCLSGMTAMTYQYQNQNGEPIWFWLENKPVKAFDALQLSTYSKTPFDIQVSFATKTLNNGDHIVVYPEKFTDKKMEDMIEQTYFSTP